VKISAVFLASVPIALVAPGLAPFLWLALFFDQSAAACVAAAVSSPLSRA
jgi:hypothetical protein